MRFCRCSIHRRLCCSIAFRLLDLAQRPPRLPLVIQTRSSPSHIWGLVFGSGVRVLISAKVGFQSLDAAMPHTGKLFVLGVSECAFGAVVPILRSVPHLDGLSHPVLDPLGVLAGVAFAVVADKNRLTQRDIVSDSCNGLMCAFRVANTLIFVVDKAVCPLLCPLD